MAQLEWQSFAICCGHAHSLLALLPPPLLTCWLGLSWGMFIKDVQIFLCRSNVFSWITHPKFFGSSFTSIMNRLIFDFVTIDGTDGDIS